LAGLFAGLIFTSKKQIAINGKTNFKRVRDVNVIVPAIDLK
jgi:hypothetical protein